MRVEQSNEEGVSDLVREGRMSIYTNTILLRLFDTWYNSTCLLRPFYIFISFLRNYLLFSIVSFLYPAIIGTWYLEWESMGCRAGDVGQ